MVTTRIASYGTVIFVIFCCPSLGWAFASHRRQAAFATKISLKSKPATLDDSSTEIGGNEEDEDEDEGALALARALQKAQNREVEKLVENDLGQRSPWYLQGDLSSSSKDNDLPFDCTSCGKCCKTKGNVWMSPAEVINAATYLNLSRGDFVKHYATFTLEDGSSTNNAWVGLKNSEESGGCVFLGEDNLCQIYEARPHQCSTYPFWTNVMSSKDAWNAEVRTPDSDPASNSVPYWTSEGGGCEGMQLIPSTASNITNGHNAGVSPVDAFQRLRIYEREEQQFPSKLPVRHVN